MESADGSRTDAPLPPLRPDIEPIPIEHEGQPMFALRDPEEMGGQTMALSPGGMLVASLLDGKRSASELRALIARETGAAVSVEQILQVAERLGRANLLETEEVRSRRRALLKEFRDSTVRKAALQGGGYPADLLELAGFLGAYLRDPKGPGQGLPDGPALAPPPLALVSPHIDLIRGGWAYAWAYQALSQGAPPDLIVALGVAHASPDSPWTLTRKAYETPYGPMDVSADLYEDIAKSLWYDPLEDEWVHRKEHSLEFQALWLKFLWREKTPPWLPVLVSSFERFCTDRPPSTVPTVEDATLAIGERLVARAKAGSRILILAGVDLAHVGPKFGDDIELGPEVERRIEGADRASLEKALALDADAFYMSSASEGHTRKICGLSALYTALRWTKALRAAAGEPPSPTAAPGRLLAYGQAPDPAGGIVSFASAIFPR